MSLNLASPLYDKSDPNSISKYIFDCRNNIDNECIYNLNKYFSPSDVKKSSLNQGDKQIIGLIVKEVLMYKLAQYHYDGEDIYIKPIDYDYLIQLYKSLSLFTGYPNQKFIFP